MPSSVFPFTTIQVSHPATRDQLAVNLLSETKHGIEGSKRILLAFKFAFSHPAAFLNTLCSASAWYLEMNALASLNYPLLLRHSIYTDSWLRRSKIQATTRTTAFSRQQIKLVESTLSRGHPSSTTMIDYLSNTKVRSTLKTLDEFRRCNIRARSYSKQSFISSPFQLYGSVSVGSDVECWPSLIQIGNLTKSGRDRTHVVQTNLWIASLLMDARLYAMFDQGYLCSNGPKRLES